jgi:hypothetical protein
MARDERPGQHLLTEIRAGSRWSLAAIRELIGYHELFTALLLRDIKVRYKQTAAGIVWIVLQPLCFVAIFSFIMNRVGSVPTGDVPYHVYALGAFVPWMIFSKGLADGSNSLVNASNLITKIYFPRTLLPIASVCGGIVDAGVVLLTLIIMMLVSGVVRRLPARARGAAAGHPGGARRGAVAVRTERDLPRRPLRAAIFDADLDVRHPDLLSHGHGPRAVATALCLQSTGLRGRDLPLDGLRHLAREHTAAPDFRRRHAFPRRVRLLFLQVDREQAG